ncbi:hypothetical protein J1TS5_26020 [Paenibacillus macerans]|uniref:hypothetical protein n=1 Tax=Paenibacillus macerans TaxID=44252 RepID=UPI001B06706B|nr:hypothetical protein [Paenibacillus macerans]GIP10432.1 hypothetical protein J1TS5_26020 [Paenibacillus macerans]
MNNNDRIQEIREEWQRVEKEYIQHPWLRVTGNSAHDYIGFLLAECGLQKREVEFWKQAAETQKNNNLAILKEHRAMKEALEWTRKRFEEEWTYEPGIGEVVDEIIGRFTQ